MLIAGYLFHSPYIQNKKMIKRLLLILCILVANLVFVQAQTSFSTTVIDSLKSVHPRLYLDSIGIVKLKVKITSGKYKTLYQNFITVVKTYGAAPTTPVDTGADLRIWGDKLLDLSVAYKLSGAVSYLTKAESYAYYLMTATNSYYNTPGLEPGHHLFGLSIFYDWCYHDMPIVLRDSLVSFISDKGGSFFNWFNSTDPATKYYLSNQLSSKTTGLGIASLAFYEAFNTKPWVDLVMKKFIFADSVRGIDGAGPEGPAYGGYELDFRMRFNDLAKQFLSYNFYTNTSWYNSNIQYQIYTSLPNNYLTSFFNVFDLGDCKRYWWTNGPNYMLRGLAKETRNGYAQQFANLLDTKKINFTESAFCFNLFRYDSTVVAKSLTTLPTFHLFDNYGIVTDRDSWSNNKSAISFTCGPAQGKLFTQYYNFDAGTGHSHPNANSFSIFSNGEFLIRNNGYNERRTQYENTLLVDTKGQLNQPYTLTYWNSTSQVTNKLFPRILKVDSTADYDLIVGDATPNYSFSVNKYLRTLIYFKSKNVVLVLDTIQSNASHKFELLFHCEQTTDSVMKLDSTYLMKGDSTILVINPLSVSSLLGVTVDTSTSIVMARSTPTVAYTNCLFDFKKTGNAWKNAVAFSWATKKLTTVPVSLVQKGNTQWTFNVGGTLYLYDWTTMTMSTVLPIQFISISVQSKGIQNRVDWETSEERNVKEFIIERSFNNTDWFQIGNILPKDSQTSNNYSFIDGRFTSFNYYRIKSVDFDGTTNISKVVSVKNIISQNCLISILPNPAKEGVTIQMSVDISKQITFVLTDLLGKTIKTKILNLSDGINNCYLSLDNLAKGTYVLSINDGSNLISKEIIKQ